MNPSMTMNEITTRLRDIESLAELAAGWTEVGKTGPTAEASTMRRVAELADELARRIVATETCEEDQDASGAMIQQL